MTIITLATIAAVLTTVLAGPVEGLWLHPATKGVGWYCSKTAVENPAKYPQCAGEKPVSKF